MNIELLHKRHDRGGFDCGVDPLNQYLRTLAGQDARRGVAAVYVLPAEDSNQIIGFYTISATALLPEELPQDLNVRMPKHDRLPALLPGRLAVDKRFAGKGYGRFLLTDALKRCVDIRARAGALFVVVEAKDDAAAEFYASFEFRRLAAGSKKMLIAMATVEKAARD